jgi:hypothetical protein
MFSLPSALKLNKEDYIRFSGQAIAGELQITALLRGNHKNTNPSSHTRGGHISKHISGLRTNKNTVMVPTEPETMTVLARSATIYPTEQPSGIRGIHRHVDTQTAR